MTDASEQNNTGSLGGPVINNSLTKQIIAELSMKTAENVKKKTNLVKSIHKNKIDKSP